MADIQDCMESMMLYFKERGNERSEGRRASDVTPGLQCASRFQRIHLRKKKKVICDFGAKLPQLPLNCIVKLKFENVPICSLYVSVFSFC